MASNYSGDLQLELVTTGEKAGLWGTITNNNLQILELSSKALIRVEFLFLLPSLQMLSLYPLYLLLILDMPTLGIRRSSNKDRDSPSAVRWHRPYRLRSDT